MENAVITVVGWVASKKSKNHGYYPMIIPFMPARSPSLAAISK